MLRGLKYHWRTLDLLALPPVLVALCLIVFIADLLTPIGYTAWMFYLLPLWLVRTIGNHRVIRFIAVLSSMLMTIPLAITLTSLSPEALQRGLFNRSLGLLSIWMLTVLLLKADREAAAAAAIQSEQAARMSERTRQLEETNAALKRQAKAREQVEQQLCEEHRQLEKVCERTETLSETNLALHLHLEEQRRIEQILHESQERLHLAMEAANMGTWDWDIENDRIIETDNIAGWFGWPDGNLPKPYEAFAQAVHPTDRDRVARAVRAALDDAAPYGLDFRIIATDGTPRWIYSKGKVFRDPSGRPVRMVGVAIDVTERKHTDAALWQALELEALILRSIPVVTYITDLADHTVIKWISENVQHVSGFPPQCFLNDPRFPLERIHPDDREGLLKNREEQLDQHGSYSAECRWLHADGSYHWFFTHLSVKQITTGAPHAGIGVWMDITDRKEAEIALHRLLEERERLSQELHDGVIQTLYALGLTLEEGGRLIQEDPAKALKSFEEAVAAINLTISDLRRYVNGFEPKVMNTAVFKTDLRQLIKLIEAFHADVVVRVSDDSIARLTPEQAEHIFFIIKEAMSNAVRHGRAEQISVSIISRETETRVLIRDNGIGFEMDRDAAGHGIRNMRSRAGKIGADFSILSSKKGTLVTIHIPYEVNNVGQHRPTYALGYCGRS